jgi:hypothetical protein
MPSRLTAEPAERAERAQALHSVQRRQAIADYSGIRIDSQGRRFRIAGARVWSLTPAASSSSEHDLQACGQAAAFSSWHWL